MTENLHDIPEHSKRIQRDAILEALAEHGPLTTCDLREGLGVMMPAARVLELRRMGFRITTRMGWHRDGEGKLRRQALYALRSKVEETPVGGVQ